jgi:hypothetical protein
MLSLCHGILPKVVSALFTTYIELGEGEGKKILFFKWFNNFAILAGMLSKVMSKIAATSLRETEQKI